jgi:hypothetical protein
VHRSGNETIGGIKTFSNGIKGYSNNFHSTFISDLAINDICLFARLNNSGHGKYIIFDAMQASNTVMCAGQFMVSNRTDDMSAVWLWRKSYNNTNNPIIGNCLVIANKNGEYYLGWRKLNKYGAMQVRDNLAWSYGSIDSCPTDQVEWIDKINIGTGDGYIITEVKASTEPITPGTGTAGQVYTATIPQTDYLDVCLAQYVRIGPDRGLLSFSGHMRDIDLPSDDWTLISIDTVMSAMGLTHRRPAADRNTGWWHYDDRADPGDRYGSGTVCGVTPAGGLELRRYYSGTDIGGWEMSNIGRNRFISVRDVYVEIE